MHVTLNNLGLPFLSGLQVTASLVPQKRKHVTNYEVCRLTYDFCKMMLIVVEKNNWKVELIKTTQKEMKIAAPIYQISLTCTTPLSRVRSASSRNFFLAYLRSV
jgi:hypothetical protein